MLRPRHLVGVRGQHGAVEGHLGRQDRLPDHGAVADHLLARRLAADAVARRIVRCESRRPRHARAGAVLAGDRRGRDARRLGHPGAEAAPVPAAAERVVSMALARRVGVRGTRVRGALPVRELPQPAQSGPASVRRGVGRSCRRAGCRSRGTARIARHVCERALRGRGVSLRARVGGVPLPWLPSGESHGLHADLGGRAGGWGAVCRRALLGSALAAADIPWHRPGRHLRAHAQPRELRVAPLALERDGLPRVARVIRRRHSPLAAGLLESGRPARERASDGDEGEREGPRRASEHVK
mmetsp:Transcript_3520/g.14270  ORF Transcript_3520/g.14270 Transcript_3520/m.14270 type:complete len:298 (+) Transcript_3520:139-1032(+)